MINLKEYCKELVEQSELFEFDSLCEMIYTDLGIVDYHMPTIINVVTNLLEYEYDYYHELSDSQRETIREYIFDLFENDKIELKKGHGYWCARESVCLVSCDEVQTELPENWNLTTWKRETIERHTDVVFTSCGVFLPCQFYVYFDVDVHSIVDLLEL